MGPDWYSEHGWHHSGMGATWEILAGYGAMVLLALLVAGIVWWVRRPHRQPWAGVGRRARSDAWPTATLARAPSTWATPRWGHDEGQLRASHADRERAVSLLRNATADGYLTLDEFEDRLGSVYAAKYLSDLDPLVADIPGRPLPAARHPAPRAWQPPARHAHPFPAGLCLLLALALGATVLHLWVSPGWPLLLVAFLFFRMSRHRRHFADR